MSDKKVLESLSSLKNIEERKEWRVVMKDWIFFQVLQERKQEVTAGTV